MAGFPKGDKRKGIKSKRPHKGLRIPSELIREALQKTNGNIARSADILGVTRTVVYTRIHSEPELKQALEEYRQRFLDDAEDVLQNKALSGDTTTLLFSLKTLGRSRGYELETNQITESVTKGALDFIYNRSKNPAES